MRCCVCFTHEIILRYKFLILVSLNLDTLYLLERGRENPCLFFEVKRGPRSKFWETLIQAIARGFRFLLFYVHHNSWLAV